MAQNPFSDPNYGESLVGSPSKQKNPFLDPDYQQPDTAPNWGTAQGAAPARQGLDMPAPAFDTSGLSLDQRTPSQRMGIDPTAGPLSNAAAMAVDSGAHAQLQQAQAEQAAADAAKKQRPAQNQESSDVSTNNLPAAGLSPLGGPAGHDAGRSAGVANDFPVDQGRAIGDAAGASLAGNGEPRAVRNAGRDNGNAALSQPTSTRDAFAAIRERRAREQDQAARTAGQAQATADQARAPEDGGLQIPAPGVPAARAPAMEGNGVAVQPQGTTNGNQTPQAQQSSPQPAQAGAAPQPAAVARNPNWRKNAIQAGRVARELGLEPKGKRLAQIVAEVDAHDAQADKVQAFAPETGTLGIPRADLPQVPAKSHGGLVNHLNAQGIAHETTMVNAADLKPTQAEYSPAKVEAAKTSTGDSAVIVSRDGYVIDGHHRAMAAAEDGKPVKAIVLDAPVDKALEAVKASPSAQASAPTAQQPAAGVAQPPEGAAVRDPSGQWTPGVRQGTEGRVVRPIDGAPTFSEAGAAAHWAQLEQLKSQAGADVASLVRQQGLLSPTDSKTKSTPVTRAGDIARGLRDQIDNVAANDKRPDMYRQEAQRLRDAASKMAENSEPRASFSDAADMLDAWAGQVAEKSAPTPATPEPVAKKESVPAAPAPQGREVSRDIGKYKEGMSEPRANQVRSELARKNPGVVYTVEEDPSLKNGYVVVGRETAPGKNLVVEKMQAAKGRAPVQFSRTLPNPQDFVPNADGGIDYGEITPEMGRAMRRQAGAIRLQQGVQNADGSGYGLAHIEVRHGKQIRSLGYDSIAQFVADSVQDFDQIWQAGSTIQLVVARSGAKGRAVFLQLEIQRSGDYYRVNSAFPVDAGYLAKKEQREEWKSLWSRYPVPADASGASGFADQSPDAGETAPMVKPRGDDSSVTPKASDAKFSLADAPGGKMSPDSNARNAAPQRLADQSTATALNDTLVRYGLGQDWSDAYEAVKLPDALSGVRDALQAAFGRDVRPVAPTAAKFDIFNGVYIPNQPNAVYVNVKSTTGFVNIAGHELWHAIKRQRPELIDWYRENSRQFYKDLPAYRDRLNALVQPGEKKYDNSKAEEELEADFMGDSLTDPAFLQQLADASPTKFRALLAQVRLWLAGVANRIKGLGSSKEVTDVKALQGYLKDVLVAFAEGKDIPAAPKSIAPNFSRTAGDQTQTEAFKKWFGESAVVDAEGKPLQVFHGTGGDFSVFTHDKAGATSRAANAGMGFFFTDKPEVAGRYAQMSAGNQNVMPVYLSLQNPMRLSAKNMMEADKLLQAEMKPENDGAIVKVAMQDGGTQTVYMARESSQVKSATGNNGDFNPANADIRFSRTSHIESSMGEMTPTQEAAYKNVAGVQKVPTTKERIASFKANLGLKMKQALVDQFAPIQDVSQQAYMLARMSKGSDGATEALLLYGKPYLRDGVLDVNIKDGGFAKVLASLKGEHDRFFMWVAAQRAERLKAEGKENLMGNEDITALRSLNAGKMADGTVRMQIYAKALQELNAFNEASLKVALESGLIDQAAYDLMKDQPYVPFYRLMEEQGGMTGPRFSSGLLNQKAWKKLKGGTQQLNADLMQNALLNWSHLYAASARNRAALATMDAAEGMGVAYKVGSETKGAVKVMRGGMTEHWMVEDPYLLEAVSALNYSASPLMKPLSAIKKLLTWGVTVNPAFKIRNLIRDSIAAVAQSPIGYNPMANSNGVIKKVLTVAYFDRLGVPRLS